MRIVFIKDNVSSEISQDAIIGLGYISNLFTKTFKLGSTVCKNYWLEILKEGVPYIEPDEVHIYDGETLIDKLYIDSVDNTDESYYHYELLDGMIKLNSVYDWSALENPTVATIINAICDSIGSAHPTIEYGGDIKLTWDQDITARELVGYVAEINGAFARFNGAGNLEFIKFKDLTPVQTIYDWACGDLKLGETKTIERVALNSGVNSVFYPNNEVSGSTVYINQDNILLTDTGTYTIENIIKHIWDEVNGFTFSLITVKTCLFDGNIKPGDLIKFVINNKEYITIAQIDWTYNTRWNGGFTLDISTDNQEEAEVKDKAANAIKRLKIVVDRELGTITQKISDTEGNISQLIQDAKGITGTFSNYDGVKYVQANANGITISSNDLTSPTELNLDDDGVRITDAQNREVAAMEADVFRTSEWMMTQTRDNTVFNIFRRWSK